MVEVEAATLRGTNVSQSTITGGGSKGPSRLKAPGAVTVRNYDMDGAGLAIGYGGDSLMRSLFSEISRQGT